MADSSLKPPAEKEVARLRRELEKALVALGARESETRQQVESAVRDAITRERRRLAELLHQTASQSLTAAYYSALVLARKQPSDAPGRTSELASLPDLIHTTIEELREITREFRESADETSPP